MDLRLLRKPKPEGTPGLLIILQELYAFTLEDVVRKKGEKVPGETAIPEGRYPVTLDYSEHFKRVLPHIRNVPGFDGILIHGGNRTEDTLGCVLVANHRSKDGLTIWNDPGESKAIDDIIEALKREEINWIEILNSTEEDI
jgi:hypothetical protein